MIAGMDYRPALWSRTGIGRYARELARAFACALERDDGLELRLYGDCLRRRGVPRGEPALPSSPHVSLHARRIPARLARWLARRGVGPRLGGIDLFHCTDFVRLPLGDTPHLVTIHDLSFLQDPAFHGSERAERLERVTRELIADASGVIAPSAFSAAEVVLHLGVPPDRVYAIHLGADHAARLAGPAPERPEHAVVITLGTIEPRKNHLRCLRALERLHAEGIAFEWWVLGGRGWLFEPFLEALQASPVRERVQLLGGGLAEGETMARLRCADVLLYPSLSEGFGLPIVEAMKLGTAVLTSAVSATAEVAGDAAWLVDPHDEDAILAGLRTLLREREERERLVAAGEQRAARFEWRECAAATLQAYRRTLSGRVRDGFTRLF